LLGLAACAAPPVADPRERGVPARAFDPVEVRAYVESEATRVLGPAPVAEASAARTAVMLVLSQSLPPPWQRPDGTWDYRGRPPTNVAVKRASGWVEWKSGAAVAMAPDRAARLDALLADPGFWAEPAYSPAEGCLDGGSLSIVVKARGRTRAARQVCGMHGRAEQLFRILE